MVHNLHGGSSGRAGNWFDYCHRTLTFIDGFASYYSKQQRMFTEVKTVCGQRTPSFEDINKMIFSEAVIMEVMRIKSVIPLGIPHGVNKVSWVITSSPSLSIVGSG